MRSGDILMKSGEKNSKSHVFWCLGQKKGIRLEEPNDNLCGVYLRKAGSALNMLTSAIEKDEIDWIATTAYYARYFSFYALLQKCGIRSEIHDCTISLMHILLVDEHLIEERFYDEFQLAKDLRVDTQYYVAKELDEEKLRRDSAAARGFVLRMEEVIDGLSRNDIDLLRGKVSRTN